MWLAAIVVVGIVTRHGDAIGKALLLLAVSFLASLLLLLAARALRVHEERSP